MTGTGFSGKVYEFKVLGVMRDGRPNYHWAETKGERCQEPLLRKAKPFW